jgi:RNA polymerase sigma-70 factor, ECF subfamily
MPATSTVQDIRVPPSDADLRTALRRARRGDEDGFRLMYRAVQPGLLRFLRVLVGDDAEDVASETWLQVARDIDSFSGDVTDFRRWVVTIARNRATDLARRQQRRPIATEQLDSVQDLPSGDDTEVAVVAAVSTEAALALIARLPRDQAQAVLLRVVLGFDANTAAEVLGKRAGAVRTVAYRGLNKLNEMLRAT